MTIKLPKNTAATVDVEPPTPALRIVTMLTSRDLRAALREIALTTSPPRTRGYGRIRHPAFRPGGDCLQPRAEDTARCCFTDGVTAGDVFAGEICGVGSTLGVRVVIGRWPVSPFGSVADAMVEDQAGRRVLVAHDDAFAAYVSSIYSFDDVIVGAVDCVRSQDRLRFRGGPLRVDVTLGRRDVLGWGLRAVPHRVATNATWVTFTDTLARVLLRGVRTRGVTAGGTELYAATDRHRVTAIDGSWNEADLGELRDVDPPVRFGFSSTPRRPSIVEITTTVHRTTK